MTDGNKDLREGDGEEWCERGECPTDVCDHCRYEAAKADRAFWDEVAEALLGPPEPGTTWGGGGILGGIRDLKAERDRYREALRVIADGKLCADTCTAYLMAHGALGVTRS